MTKLFAFAFTATAVIALVGCSGGQQTASKSDASPSTTPSTSPKPFKVALLTPGPVSDSGWSAMAYEGLQAIEKEMGAKVVQNEAKGTQIRDAMRTFAQDGYQLVLGHGFEYNEPGVELSAQFPNTAFVSSSGGKSSKTAGAFRFYLEQGFYLAGELAALTSKSGKIASVGINVPSIISTFKAFEAGAKAAKPTIQVKQILVPLDKSSDVAEFKRATEQVLDDGADFVIHQANEAAQGVFDACRAKNAYAFGANSNQNDNSSGVVIASATIIAKPAFLAIAKDVKEGKYHGGVSLFGMDSGAIDFVINPSMKSKITPEALAKIEADKAAIVKGSITVPKDEF